VKHREFRVKAAWHRADWRSMLALLSKDATEADVSRINRAFAEGARSMDGFRAA